MKHQHPWWMVFSILPPLILLCGLLVGPSGCGGGGSSSPTPAPTSASVAVALVGVPPQGNFRSVLLNISGIRINQSSGATSTSPGWVTIAVPSGVGTGNQQNPGDLQLDLIKGQTQATFFNIGGVPAATYNTVQVLVDPLLPGTIVPACQAAISNTEGCVNYPLEFNTISANLNNVIFTLPTPLTVSANATAPLVLQLAVSIATGPVDTGDPYVANISASEVNFGSFLGTVTGSVSLKGTSSSSTFAPLSVSAEVSGTNTIIETAPVKAKGVYTLELPAASGGTTYDIFTSGGTGSFETVQNIRLVPGLSVTENLSPTAVTPTTFTGTISDGCTGSAIQGAQLELLAPPPATMLPKPRPTPPAPGFCLSNPDQCVAVASATTDQSGDYPLPGTTKNPAPFSQIPLGNPDLAVRVTASGYSSLFSGVFLKANKNQVCSASSANPSTICNFSLTTGYISGTVNLVTDPPPGNSVMVQVFAENSGTNQIVSALTQPVVFRNQQTSQPFTLNVPITGAGPNFDLFAVAIDPYLGATSPFPGHDISVLADVPAPSAPCAFVPPVETPQPTPPAVPEPTPTPLMMPAMDCVGHGSITGTVQNPDSGTTIEVEKLDTVANQEVQVLGTASGLFSSSNPNGNAQYSLCVPPDDYVLQRFETLPTATPGATMSGTAIATPIPTPTAIGPAQPVTVPQPGATSSPCPSSCSNSDSASGPCPGICTGTSASPL